MPLTVHLVDLNPAVTDAWRAEFSPFPEVDAADLSSVAVPGLCALSGRMAPARVARQMRIAYERVLLGRYAYSHWREERAFEAYVMGRTPHPPEDLARPYLP